MEKAQKNPLYEQVGGADGVLLLVNRFYQRMAEETRFATLRQMHPADLSGSRDKLFAFLSGWFGGPNLYVEHFGQPFMRRRHLNFSIGTGERDQWLQCMAAAMADCGFSPELQLQLGQAFFKLADFMRNRED